MLDNSTSGPFTDLWSLGIIAYEILIGGKPFDGDSTELYNKIQTRDLKFPDFTDPVVKDFIDKLLQLDPTKRLGFNDFFEIKNHDFFDGFDFGELGYEDYKPILPERMKEIYKIDDDLNKSEKQDRGVWAKKEVGGVTLSTRYTLHSTMNKEEPVTRASFGILKRIGQGAYGQVYLVRKRDDDKVFAMKEISMQHLLTYNKTDSVYREREILEFFNDPRIVRLECTFKDDENLYFLMEYAERGSLEEALKLTKKLPIETARHFTAEIILALETLHDQDYCHRDLKPGNILFDS